MISIVKSIHGQRYNITILLAFLDGSTTYAEDSQVGRLSW